MYMTQQRINIYISIYYVVYNDVSTYLSEAQFMTANTYENTYARNGESNQNNITNI